MHFHVGRSNAESLLDEEDTKSDTHLPNKIITKGDDTHTLSQITESTSIADWAKQNVSDTHIEKRKLKAAPRKEKGKKQKVTDEPFLGSDESTPIPDEGRTLPYQSSNLSTSASSDDDDGDDEGYRIEPSHPPIQLKSTIFLKIFLFPCANAFACILSDAVLGACAVHNHPWA
jgi:hypothetical protein